MYQPQIICINFWQAIYVNPGCLKCISGITFSPANKNLLTISFILYLLLASQPANIGPQDVPRTSPSNVPRTSPEDPIWPSSGRPDLTFRGRPNLTSWGRPEITSRGCLNLTFKWRPWEVDSGRPQDVFRTSPRGPSEYSNLDI